MHRLGVHCTLVTIFLISTLATALPAQAQQKLPDSTLYTLYDATALPATQINWVTCGSVGQGDGCYGSGSFGPFTNACAIVQSVPTPLNFNTVLRYIYILDTSSTTGGATLSAYKRTDEVLSSSDTITISRLAVVPLPSLVAGPGSTCAMAQNPSYVYTATNQGSDVMEINKTNLSASLAGSTGQNVADITADSYGFVTVVWGSGFDTSTATYAPNGQLQESGGGSYFMINPIDAVYPATYPPFDRSSLP